MESTNPPTGTKTCASCGRDFQWRAKWAKNWAEVKYCSTHCRRRGLKPVDIELERVILAMLKSLPKRQTLSPADVVDHVCQGKPDSFAQSGEPLREPARRAARRLAARGQVSIVQGGRIVDPSGFRGPMRIGHGA